MEVARTYEAVVEEIDRKIYVIGGCEDDVQVEVFDPKSRSWKVGESPDEKLQLRLMNQLSASLNGKVYIVETGRIAVYDPREGHRLDTVNMSSDTVWSMCVVDDVLYACYFGTGLMWFDAKRKIWNRLLGVELLDAKIHRAVMAEYNRKLAILWPDNEFEPANNVLDPVNNEIKCAVIASELVGEKMHGKVEWSGIVATMPGFYMFHKCLLVSS